MSTHKPKIHNLIEYIVTFEYNETRLVTPYRLRYLLYFLQWGWANEHAFRDTIFDDNIVLNCGLLQIPSIEVFLCEQKKPHIHIPCKQDLWDIVPDPYERMFIDQKLILLANYSTEHLDRHARTHTCWKRACNQGNHGIIQIKDMPIPTPCPYCGDKKCKNSNK